MAVSHTPETRTTFDDLLKYDYAPAVIQATAEKSFLLSHLESVTGKVGFGGKSFVIPLRFDNMGSAASLAETDDLPDSLPGSYENSTVSIKYHYFSVSATGPAMKTSEQDKHAFAEAWAEQIAVKSRSFRQHLNRQLNGDGNGYLCQVDGAPSTVYVTVDNAYGLSGFNSSDVNGAKFLTSNMKVDFMTGSTVRDSGAVKIVSVSTQPAWPSTSAVIDTTGSTITSVADGDYVVVHNSYGHEAPGLRILIDDGTVAATFQGVTVASYPDFASHVHYGSTPGTAEAITRNRIQTLIDDIEVDGGNVDYLLTSNAVWLTIGDMMANQQQLVSYDTIKGALDTGWRAIMFGGIPIYKDPYCIDHIYAIDNRCIKIHEAGAPGWLDYNGILQQQAGKDQWNAYWAWYMTPAMHNRKWCGKIQDISVTANKI